MDKKQELFNTIWKIAEDLRGEIDGWDFKSYVLGFLFYRFISENICDYINEGERNSDPSFDYSLLSDNEITNEIKNDIINEKGFFIYPSQLFKNTYLRLKKDYRNLNEELSNILTDIENTSIGTKSENNLKGIFTSINLTWTGLGSNLIAKNQRLFNVLEAINNLDIDSFLSCNNDIFGDAYEFLMGMYASNAGKSGGEYFTPQCVSRLLTLLAIDQKTKIRNVYDPTCGSGSLLLQAKKILGIENISNGFYGQELNPTTYNLCRMNMFLHNVSFDKFDILEGNTLTNPLHDLNKKFEIIVSNPPYSKKWEGKQNPILINDERFMPAGVLAPTSKSDYAFIMHSLYMLDVDGKAAIVSFPGIFYRDGAEKQIRQYLIDNNFIDCIIALPNNLFYGTSINVDILVLSKSKKDNNVLFIDATQYFEKKTNQNELSQQNIDEILKIYHQRTNIDHISTLASYEEIKNNDYELSVNTYVEPEKNEEIIDIKALNSEIEKIVKRNDELRTNINKIIKEIDNE